MGTDFKRMFLKKEGKRLKEQLLYLLKKYKFKLLVEAIFLILLVYLSTCPAKYLGKIIDLLNDIDSNKSLIIQNVFFIILSSIGIILTRLIMIIM